LNVTYSGHAIAEKCSFSIKQQTLAIIKKVEEEKKVGQENKLTT
jgi:hypothetical protein